MRVLFVLAALAGLAACGGSATSGSGISVSDINPPIFSGTSGTLGVDGGGGVSFSAVINPTGGALTKADILAGLPALPEPPTSDSVTMEGRFGLVQIQNLTLTGGVYSGDTDTVSGDISLVADFGSGTLTGSSAGLEINGAFSDSELDGTFRYGLAEGELDGFIGGDAAIGIFVGENEVAGEAVAGGFIVAAP